MKNFLLLMGFVMMSYITEAQTIKFSEDFETLPLEVTSSGTSTWARSNVLQYSGSYSDTANIVNAGDTAILTTDAIDISGYSYAKLSFEHICKISFFDAATIEVSTDNGVNWTPLTGASYLGQGNFVNIGNKFTSTSYVNLWDATNSGTIPTNSWWVHEDFDLNAYVGSYTQFKIRFVLVDGNGSGGMGNYGWLLDDIKLLVSTDELVPPVISLENPILTDSVVGAGPFTVTAQITDVSGIDTALLEYTIAGVTDTVGMLNVAGHIFEGNIPSQVFGTVISYRVIAFDASSNNNTQSTNSNTFYNITEPMIVDIGNGTSGSYTSPFYNGTMTSTNNRSSHISIIKADEIGGLYGLVQKLSFIKYDMNAYTSNDAHITIYLKNTSTSSVPNDSAAFYSEYTGATQVYLSTTDSIQGIAGLVSYDVSGGNFIYDGTSNIMVIVDWYRPSALAQNYIKYVYGYNSSLAKTFYGNVFHSSTSSSLGHRLNMQLEFSRVAVDNDVALDTVINPQPVIIAGNNDVKIRLRNEGDLDLNKATVSWEIDNVLQPSYTWLGNLQYGLVSNDFSIGSHSFSQGPHSVKIWAHSPNDLSDQQSINDTIKFDLYSCNNILNGYYTVGGASADFATIDDVMDALTNCGINGPTTIAIIDGTYDYSFVFDDNIPGIDSINTLTFTSASADPTKVIINNSSVGNQAVLIDGIRYLNITHLTLKDVVNSPITIIALENNASHINIDNCIIEMLKGDNYNVRGIAFANGIFKNIHITNNKFIGGYYGIHTNSSVYTNPDDLVISGNTLEDFSNRGIYVYRSKGCKIINNKLTNYYDPNTTSGTYGIYVYYGDFVEVSGNEVVLHKDGPGEGLHLYKINGEISNYSKVYNNISIIKGNSSSTTYRAFYLGTSSFVDIYSNTFVSYAGSSTSETFYLSNSTASDVRIKNNIIAAFGGSYAIETSSSMASVSLFDYNCYYSSGGVIGKYDGTLATSTNGLTGIQTVTSDDTNSIVTDPMLYSINNARSFSTTLSAAADPVSYITTDIDGKTRSTTSPSIGASEFTVAAFDAGVIEILNPLPIDTQNRLTTINVVVRNFGTSPISAMDIKYSLNGAAPTTYAWTGTLAPAGFDTVLIPSFTVPVLDYSLDVFTNLTADTNTFNDSIVFNSFGLPLIDVEIVELIDPTNGCDKTTSDTVLIRIVNSGLLDIENGITASYSIDGASSFISEVVTDTILVGESIVYKFNQTVDMAPGLIDSTYNFILAVSHNNDPVSINDTINKSVVSMAPLSIPLISDTTINYGDEADLLAISTDNITWYLSDTSSNVLYSGDTYTTPMLFDTTTYWLKSNSSTPPSTAKLGTATNYYGNWDNTIYGGGSQSGKQQILYKASELIAAGLNAGEIQSIAFETGMTFTAPAVSFKISMANTLITNLSSNYEPNNMDVVYNSTFTGVAGWNTHTLTETFVWDGTSNIIVQICAEGIGYFAAPVYYTATTYNSIISSGGYGVSCSSTSGLVNNKRPNTKFKTKTVQGCSSPLTSVDVNVPLPQFDGAVNRIVSPTTSCGISQTQVSIAIINQGTDTLVSGYTATYSINNGAYITPETVTSDIAPSDTLEFVFATLANLPSGYDGTNYIISAKINNSIDEYSPNDSIVSDSIKSLYTPTDPVVSGQLVDYANSAILSGTSSDSLFWYSDSTANNMLSTDNPFTTSPIFDTTTFWVQSQRHDIDSTYQVGNGAISSGTSGPSPYGSGGYAARNQYIITAAELKAMGLIQGYIKDVAFDVSVVQANILNNFTIKMGNTEFEDLNTTEFDSTLTTVYGPMSYVEYYGWNTHSFQTPFFWDGESNLMVETSFKNNSTTAYATVQCNSTTYKSSGVSKGYSTYDPSDVSIHGSLLLRPNMKITQEGLGLCASSSFPVLVEVYNIPTVDGGMIGISEPISMANSTIASPVKVVINNYGLNNLTVATINWSENAVVQTPYSWTGTLANGQSDTVVIDPAHNFMGGTTSIKAWTSIASDTITTNDTIERSISVCMSGTYTIGNTATNNYSSLGSAVADLKLNGVCGPVIFNIDSGAYNERIVIKDIAGVNSTNTITFQSTDGDSSYVNIFNNTTSGINYIVRIKDIEYITFKNLAFTANGSQYGNVFHLEGTTNNITISNNLFNGTIYSGNSGVASALYSKNSNASNIVFSNNRVNNFYKVIYFSHTENGHYGNLVIENNNMHDFTSEVVHVNHIDSVYIIGNTMQSETGSTLYGIYLYYVENGTIIKENTIDLKTTSSAYGLYVRVEGTPANRCLIANNSISLQLQNSSGSGIYITYSEYLNILYNSVNVIGGSATGIKAFNAYGGSDIIAVNNNIATQNGYVLYATSSNAFSQLDYNNYYVSPNSTKFAKWSGTDIADLASLQSLDVSLNVHALTVIPDYYSNTDLHSMQIGLYNTGTPSAVVTTDKDGNTRSTSAPSIGAYEFSPPAIDMSAYEITYPISNSCDFTATDSIVVMVRNFGINDLNFANTPLTITVEIGGINPDTIAYTVNSGTLNSGDATNYKVTSNYDLSLNGTYNITAHTTILNDGNNTNDYSDENVVISFSTISNFPFSEDFETGNNISFNDSTDINSDINVTSFAGNSSSFGLHLTGGSFSGWSYSTATVDEAFANTTHVSKAYSCNVDATSVSNLSLQFDLKQTANTPSKTSWFRVMLTDVNGTHYIANVNGDTVFNATTVMNDIFAAQLFNLDAYIGQTFSLSFEAANKYVFGYNSSDGDNVLIDNIAIWEPANKDLSINSIVKGENFGPVGTAAHVTVALENFGLDTLHNIPLAYNVNNGAYIRDTFYTSIAPSMRDTFTFAQQFNLTSGSIKVTAINEYVGDMINDNDTAVAYYKGMITVIPNYSDNFEGTDNWMQQGDFGQWELGMPNTANIDTAHSGINAWVTRLSTDYTTSAVEYLYSPYITIPTYTDTATVEFWQYMRVVSNKVSGTLEYTIDNGNVWSSIGYIGIPGSVNWYNSVITGQHVWNSMNNGWIKSSIKLDPTTFNTGNEVQFRFKFATLSNNVTDEGWAIDDFKIYFPSLQTDAGIAGIISPLDSVEIGSNQNVTVMIKNFGTDTIFTTDVKYTVGTTVVTETFNGVIPSDSLVEFTFAQTYLVDANTNNICITTLLSGDMQSVNDNMCKTLVATLAAKDAGVSSIHAPYGETTIGAATVVKVYITNYGSDPITTCDVQYTVSGINAVTETFTGNIATGDSAEYVFTTTYASLTGTYSVCARTQLANDADATNDSKCVQVVGTGIENASGDNFVVVQNQPNPAENNTVVDYYLPKAGTVTITMVNVLGKTIFNIENTHTQGKHQWNVDVNKLESGVYYYTVTFDEQSYTYKMIIVK